jgi:hypothetical protein
MLATSTAMRPQRQAQLLQRNIEQRLGGVRQHPDATEILMLSGMTRIRRQKVVGAGIKPLVKEGFRFVDLATKGGTARVTATAPRTAQIITPLGPVSSTAKGRLHALSQQRTFSAPLTNSANFFRA